MLCQVRRPDVCEHYLHTDHAIWGPQMSTLSHNSNIVPLMRLRPARADEPQFHSWPRRLRHVLNWADRARERDALRALADNKHLLNDIGLSRDQALGEADRLFWQ